MMETPSPLSFCSSLFNFFCTTNLTQTQLHKPPIAEYNTMAHTNDRVLTCQIRLYAPGDVLHPGQRFSTVSSCGRLRCHGRANGAVEGRGSICQRRECTTGSLAGRTRGEVSTHRQWKGRRTPLCLVVVGAGEFVVVCSTVTRP